MIEIISSLLCGIWRDITISIWDINNTFENFHTLIIKTQKPEEEEKKKPNNYHIKLKFTPTDVFKSTAVNFLRKDISFLFINTHGKWKLNPCESILNYYLIKTSH